MTVMEVFTLLLVLFAGGTWKTFSNVVVTNDNCYVMASILKKIIEYDKSDLKKYMHENLLITNLKISQKEV